MLLRHIMKRQLSEKIKVKDCLHNDVKQRNNVGFCGEVVGLISVGEKIFPKKSMLLMAK